MELTTLRSLIHDCQACPLYVAGHGVPGAYFVEGGVVPPFGQCDIMFVGEAPGAVEQEKLVPFVGSAGVLFHRLVAEAGITRYYVTNMAKHRPPKKQGKQTAPEPDALKACRPLLDAEIAFVRPKSIVLMGKVAAKLVVPGNFTMKSQVGKRYTLLNVKWSRDDWVFEPGQVIVVWHPAAFLHTTQPRAQQTMMNQFRRALAGLIAEDTPRYKIMEVSCPTHPTG